MQSRGEVKLCDSIHYTHYVDSAVCPRRMLTRDLFAVANTFLSRQCPYLMFNCLLFVQAPRWLSAPARQWRRGRAAARWTTRVTVQRRVSVTRTSATDSDQRHRPINKLLFIGQWSETSSSRQPRRPGHCSLPLTLLVADDDDIVVAHLCDN